MEICVLLASYKVKKKTVLFATGCITKHIYSSASQSTPIYSKRIFTLLKYLEMG